MKELTHLDDKGNAHMVDISAKEITSRQAVAEGTVTMSSEAFEALQGGLLKKGDALAVARVAGIMAAKQTSTLIPLCHPLPISSATVDFALDPEQRTVTITATVAVTGRTGVEMEALTAVSVAALTIYDMCKALDKGITIDRIRLLEKQGGKSGEYRADDSR
jgi:cyclic pyranopterin monophosphate synthase